MKNKILWLAIIVFIGTLNIFGQLSFPKASPKASISQVVGDTDVSIVYNRPNVKERKVWGELVPLGKIWRTGANEATVFEVSNDVMINGQKLPKGKYSLHTIPTENEWTIIFNKTWNQWGSFNYDEKQDALRVKVKPMTGDFKETMTIGFDDINDNSAQIFIAWEKIKVPFTLDIGDVNKRVLDKARRQMVSDPITTANFIYSSKMTDQYAEALTWLDKSIAASETFAALSLKARILADMGKKEAAIKSGEKAVEVGKKSNPPANTASFEQTLAQWKSGK